MRDHHYSAIILGAASIKAAALIIAALLPSCGSLLPAPCPIASGKPQACSPWAFNLTLFRKRF